MECCNIMQLREDIESLSSMSHLSNPLQYNSYHDIELQCQGLFMESNYMVDKRERLHLFLIIILNTTNL